MVSWLALVAPSARTSEAGRLAFSTVVLCYTAFHSTCVIQRYSNGKTCLPKRKMVSTLTSCDVDHVLKWTRLSVRISAVGSKVMRKYIAGEGRRAWGRGYLLHMRIFHHACSISFRPQYHIITKKHVTGMFVLLSLCCFDTEGALNQHNQTLCTTF